MRLHRQRLRTSVAVASVWLGVSLLSMGHAAQPQRRRFPNAPRPSEHVINAIHLVRKSTATGLKIGVPSAAVMWGVMEGLGMAFGAPHEALHAMRQASVFLGSAVFSVAGALQSYETGSELFGRRRAEDVLPSVLWGMCAGIASIVPEAVGLVDLGVSQWLGMPPWADFTLTGLTTIVGTASAIEGVKVVRNIFQDDRDPLFHRIWESLRLPENKVERSLNIAIASLSGLGLGVLLAGGLDVPLNELQGQLLVTATALGLPALEGLRQAVDSARMQSERVNDILDPLMQHLIKRPLLATLIGIPTGLALAFGEGLFTAPPDMSWMDGIVSGIQGTVGGSLVLSAQQKWRPALQGVAHGFQSLRNVAGVKLEQLRERWHEKQRIRELLNSDLATELGLAGDWTADKGTLADAIRKTLLVQVHPQGGEHTERLREETGAFETLQAYFDPLDPPL